MDYVIYPVILTRLDEGGYLVTVPDLYEWGTGSSGKDMFEAIFMARDFISLICTELQDEGKPLPEPSDKDAIGHDPGDIVTLVDANLKEYRRSINNMSVRRNVTIPGWLDYEANKAQINVSAVLQDALKAVLGIDDAVAVRLTQSKEARLRFTELCQKLQVAKYRIKPGSERQTI